MRSRIFTVERSVHPAPYNHTQTAKIKSILDRPYEFPELEYSTFICGWCSPSVELSRLNCDYLRHRESAYHHPTRDRTHPAPKFAIPNSPTTTPTKRVRCIPVVVPYLPSPSAIPIHFQPTHSPATRQYRPISHPATSLPLYDQISSTSSTTRHTASIV